MHDENADMGCSVIEFRVETLMNHFGQLVADHDSTKYESCKRLGQHEVVFGLAIEKLEDVEF
jgi:hypothetical protein